MARRLPGWAPVAIAVGPFVVRWYALAYVAGFLALPAPGGLGVREYVLLSFLAPAASPPESRAIAVVVVLLLRL